MKALSRITLAAAGLVMAGQTAAQITFYEREGFDGRSFTTQGQVRNFESAGFNDRASSVVVVAASAGRCARTASSGAVASSCARASTRRLPQWD